MKITKRTDALKGHREKGPMLTGSGSKQNRGPDAATLLALAGGSTRNTGQSSKEGSKGAATFPRGEVSP